MRRGRRIELGKSMIANILFEYGERTPTRRTGRSRNEEALRGTFETSFAGAQWVADGKTVEVVTDGEVLNVNLELVVDAATDAAVGIDARDEEDSAALLAALDVGVETTGEPPLAMLVDDRPSNHAPQVDTALGDTMRIDATPGRAQNKAQVEGAFGLFAQKVPPFEIDTTDSHLRPELRAAFDTSEHHAAGGGADHHQPALVCHLIVPRSRPPFSAGKWLTTAYVLAAGV